MNLAKTGSVGCLSAGEPTAQNPGRLAGFHVRGGVGEAMGRTFGFAAIGIAALLLAADSASAGGYHGGGSHGGGYYGHGGGHHHGGGTRVAVGINAPYWPYWWGPGAAWWGGAYWYPGSVWYGAPPWPGPSVVVQPPAQVYVERPTPTYVQPPPPPSTWWYYCPSSEDYYPNVPSCPQPWVKVAPRDE